VYRESDRPGTALYTLKRIFPGKRKGEVKKRTEAAYLAMDIWKGIDPAVVKEVTRRATDKAEQKVKALAHKLKVAAATKRANAAKQMTAGQRARIARSLLAQGKTQKEIAAAVGIKTTRGVRKLLKR
jgi:hypothetical protein